MNTSRNITDLPLEVLILIFVELEDLEDRLSLAQVHPHIELAFFCRYGKRIKTLNLAEKKLSVLLPLYGSSVEHVNGDYKVDATTLKLVELHCPNLQSIEMNVCQKNINSVKSFLANVRILRSINLTFGVWPLKNNLGIFELLKFQPSLRILRLDLFRSNKTRELQNLVNLEELTIIYTILYEKTLDLHELCHRLKNLRKLKIKGPVLTAPKEFDGVPCPALRELYLAEPHPWCFKDRYPCTPDILNWVFSHAERLERLTIHKDFPDYEQETIIYKILSECKNLRYLCKRLRNFDKTFAHRVIKIVSENGVTSEERPLELDFVNDIFHHHIIKVKANTAAEQLITIKNFVYKK